MRRLLAYLPPLASWGISLALTFGLPLAGLWFAIDAMPAGIPVPSVIAAAVDRALAALEIAPWSPTAIPLPSPGAVIWLGKTLAALSAAFLGLILLSYALSPLRRLIRAQDTAVQVPEASALYAGLQAVAERCGQKMPALWVIETPALNAQALAAPGGRRAVLLTSGLMQSVTDDELLWVFAHELAHLRYGDAAGTGLWVASRQWSASARRLRAATINRMLRKAGRMSLIWYIAPVLALFCTLFSTSADLIERFALAVLVFLTRSASRRAEFRADAYATVHIGQAPGIRLLNRLAASGSVPLADLVGTHPSAGRRIAKIRASASSS